MRKVLKKIKIFIQAVLFVGILVFLISNLAYVLREKEGTNIHDNFRQLERDSVDMVFIGTSHQFCTINPDLLYDEYGINSFMLATSAQTIPMSYYAAMEAIEFQHPGAIVLEVVYCSNDFRTVTPEMSHTFFDGMPMSKAKVAAIEDLIEEEEQIYYYLNLGRYHTRWKELTEVDFQSNLTAPRGRFFSKEIVSNWEIPVISPDEKQPMPDEMLKYMDKIVALCKENDVELILYVAPFNTLYISDYETEKLYERQRIFNWIGDYAKENDVRFYNLFYEMDEIGLDGNRDYMDSQHFNCYGQDKVTRYMAEKGYFYY